MRFSLLWCSITFFSIHIYAQKPAIDINVLDKWPSIQYTPPSISNNGDYFSYSISNQPIGSHTLVLKSINGRWEARFPDAGNAQITDNSRLAVFINSKDSLCLVTLGSDTVTYIPQVRSFQFLKPKKEEWIAYMLNTTQKNLIICNLLTGYQHSFSGVITYLSGKDGNLLLLQEKKDGSGRMTETLNWVQLPEGTSRSIWTGMHAGNLVFGSNSQQAGFTVTDTTGKVSLWYYKSATNSAEALLANNSTEIPDNLILDRISGFSNDGKRLFLLLKEREKSAPTFNSARVNIWSYKDKKLQSLQLKELEQGITNSYAGVIIIPDKHVIRLQRESERMAFFGKQDDLAYIIHNKGNYAERWNASAQPNFHLISTITGERKDLSILPLELSPNGKYLVGIDISLQNYFSYEITTGITRNITSSLPIPMKDSEFDQSGSGSPRGLMGIAAWLANDTSVLIYDKYDIWQLDLTGHSYPISATNSYGRKSNTIFRLAEEYPNRIIPKNKQIILSAFNLNNKNNGFYLTIPSQHLNPELLSMGPYIYHIPGIASGSALFSSPFVPIKARDKDIYVVRRESSAQSPNYFYTTNFKAFTPLTDLYPEKSYNWLTSELINFKTSDGHKLQAVLYKPENFNPFKKYPVLIHYYERKSDELNQYKKPEAANDAINIPWFVSNGYLVITPDIYYTLGNPGQCALKSIMAVTGYIKQFHWIDSTKIGIQGHSFGGYETNYIVTHTNFFAAAMSAAGTTDLISDYGSLWGNGMSKQFTNELGQSRIGSTLWQRPDLYIKNSPIFQADKVNTPLLIMHNKEDAAVSFAQAIEFFTALRRLGKRVWMLQYDGEAHSLFDEKSTIDYTIRLTQFFDHYLKGSLPPKWMTEGVPASKKEIDNGLELDTRIKTPGLGLGIK